MTLSNEELIRLVDKELESMLQRCVQSGAGYEEALSQLSWKLVPEMHQIAQDQRTTEEAPYALLLQEAYDCYKKGDKDGNRAASEAWLAARHNVRPGNVIQVNGWVKPREILLDAFSLSWGYEEDASITSGFMWFEGPTSHFSKEKQPGYMCASIFTSGYLGASLPTSVRKIEASPKLKKAFPERNL